MADEIFDVCMNKPEQLGDLGKSALFVVTYFSSDRIELQRWLLMNTERTASVHCELASG
jgi:hypothetical protein